jgi:hypothetical protein
MNIVDCESPGSLQQMEMSKAGDAGKVTVSLAPDLDEFGLTAGCNAKSIHGDKHSARLLQEAVVRKRRSWFQHLLGYAVAATTINFAGPPRIGYPPVDGDWKPFEESPQRRANSVPAAWQPRSA